VLSAAPIMPAAVLSAVRRAAQSVSHAASCTVGRTADYAVSRASSCAVHHATDLAVSLTGSHAVCCADSGAISRTVTHATRSVYSLTVGYTASCFISCADVLLYRRPHCSQPCYIHYHYADNYAANQLSDQICC